MNWQRKNQLIKWVVWEMTSDNLNKSYKIKIISWKKKMKKFKAYLMNNKN